MTVVFGSVIFGLDSTVNVTIVHKHKTNMADVTLWCEENIGKRYEAWDRKPGTKLDWTYGFNSKKNATLFLLRWG